MTQSSSPTRLATRTVDDLLDAFASTTPLPAGGSAAALTGAVGVALLVMAASMPKTRAGMEGEAGALAEAAQHLSPLRGRLTAGMDDDVVAYEEVLAVMRLPRGSDEEKATRRDALQVALRHATEPPLAVMRACAEALRAAVPVARAAPMAVAGDVAVGVELVMAAVTGAGHGVRANLAAIRDEAYVTATAAERQQLEQQATADAQHARSLLAIT